MRVSRGFTLVELVVFMVVISIALVGVMQVFQQAAVNSVDPVIQSRALECAQAKMDEILSRPFDSAAPPGGIPACDSSSAGAVACGSIGANSSLADVGDYQGHTDTSMDRCSVSVTVVSAGDQLGITQSTARRVTVTATSDGGGQAVLSSYKANF